MPRDAPSEEWVPGPEDEAGVDLRRACHDAFVEDAARLVREGVEDLPVDLGDARAVVAFLEDGQVAVGERLERRRQWEAIAECSVERVEDMVRDPWADHGEKGGGRHRDAEAERCLIRLLE